VSIKDELQLILNTYRNAASGEFNKSPLGDVFLGICSLLRNSGPVSQRPDIVVQYGVGKGKWAHVPWIALRDKHEAMQNGVYCVYLFCGDMSGVYLTLGHGVDVSTKKEAETTTSSEHRRTRIRQFLAPLSAKGFQTTTPPDLKSTTLRPRRYEESTFAHRLYRTGNLPEDDTLLEDLETILRAYDDYLSKPKGPQPLGSTTHSAVDMSMVAVAFQRALANAGIVLSGNMPIRILASILAKRFVILTGLSGSGKTRVAQALARWLTPLPREPHAPNPHYAVVSVGADWTSSEHVLGYPDGLDKTRYVRTKALDLILRALAAPELPHFLILDEMNLSHVERYFADLLSSLESGEPLHLHSDKGQDGAPAVRDGVPGEVRLPPNLFVVGTVNVDETTYMFSPKVLDRANVLEFRVTSMELKEFLARPSNVEFGKLDAEGAAYGTSFLRLADQAVPLRDSEGKMFEAELLLFFETLQAANAEFGFRVAKEGASFLHFHQLLSGPDWRFQDAMDAQILQKLLPKLHGSRNSLEPVLCALATLCFAKRTWEVDLGSQEFAYLKQLRTEAAKALRMEDESLDPLGLTPDGTRRFPPAEAHYPLSFEKALRMLERLRCSGFTSFAEA